MAWEITYQPDSEAPGVGVLTATNGSVRVSRRLDTNDGGDIQKFLDECVETRAVAMKIQDDSAAVVAKIEAVLNKDEPAPEPVAIDPVLKA